MSLKWCPRCQKYRPASFAKHFLSGLEVWNCSVCGQSIEMRIDKSIPELNDESPETK